MRVSSREVSEGPNRRGLWWSLNLAGNTSPRALTDLDREHCDPQIDQVTDRRFHQFTDAPIHSSRNRGILADIDACV